MINEVRIWKKRTIMLLLVFSFFKKEAFSQEIIQNIINCATPITFNIAGTSQTSIGTGTLIFKNSDTKKPLVLLSNQPKVLLLTVKHVLPKVNEASFINVLVSKKALNKNEFDQIEVPIYNNKGDYLPYIHVDGNEDLAIIDFTSFYYENQLTYLKDYLLLSEQIADTTTLKQLDLRPSRQIFFAGYPGFYFEARNVSPIIRTGVIATDPNTDYYFNDFTIRGKILHGFLIDASAFGGSSGSLVINSSQDIYYARFGESQTTGMSMQPMYIIGILTESYFDQDTRNKSGFMNLGGVISSHVISDYINSLY